MAVRTVEVIATGRFASRVTIDLTGSRVSLVLMLVVAEVLARHPAFVPAIAGHRRPGELERQQSQHEDCKPTTHCEECSSYKDWRWSDEDKGVLPIRTRRFSALRHALKKLEGEKIPRRRCGGTSR